MHALSYCHYVPPCWTPFGGGEGSACPLLPWLHVEQLTPATEGLGSDCDL